MSTPTVLHFISSSEVGGAQKHLFELVRWNTACSWKYVVASPPGPLAEWLAENNEDVRIINMGYFTFLQLAFIIHKVRPAIIHVHLLGAALHGMIACLLISGSRLVYTIHNEVIYPGMPLWKQLLHRVVTRLVSWKASVVITVSSRIAVYLTDSLMIPATKVFIIPSGVDFEILESNAAMAKISRQRVPLPDVCRLVGTVGRVSYHKGHDVLIEAFRTIAGEFPEMHCIIIGEGEWREKLLAMISGSDLKNRIHFIGVQKEVLAWLRLFDIAIFPSRTEGLPVAVIEAAYAGKPIIASAVGDVDKIVQNETTGLLVVPDDPQGLAEAIRRLLVNPSLANELGRNAKDLVMERFGIENCRRRILKVYETLYPRLGNVVRSENDVLRSLSSMNRDTFLE